ncbi:MAG TPA: T9SS type A sorting domain-containing protein, partial [Candidatus Eisenbacteria bacterium]
RRNEIITVTALCNGMPIVIGPQNVVLAPGGTTRFSVPCVLPVNCEGDVYVSLTATAAIEGFPDCRKEMTATKPIGCAEGCIDVVACRDEVLACNGSTVNVPFVIRNCTGATEEVVTISATCDGKPVVLPITMYTIGAGDSVTVEVPCRMPDWCMGPVEVKLTANARKSGSIETACPAMDMAICPVQCVEACVTSVSLFEGKVCPGDSVCVPFEVQNCTETADEVLTFKFKCDGMPIMDLPITLRLGPGQKDTVCVPCRIPDQCDADGFKVVLTTFASIPGLEACEFKDHAEAILECGTVCVAVNDPVALEGCPGDTVEVPFDVTNCGDVTIDVNMMAACNGMLTDAVDPHHFVLTPGQSIVSTVTCIIPEECKPGEYLTVVNSAWAKGFGGDGGCAMDIAGDTRIYCVPCETEGGCGPIALNAPPGAESCPGDPVSFQFTVENQGQSPVNVAITTPTPGWTFVPNNFNNLATSVPTNVTAYGTAPADYNQSQQLVICAAASFNGVVCDSTKDYVNVTAKKILFQVEKTADPDTVTALNSTSRISIRVASYKESGPLNPISVVDRMPEGIAFAGNVSSNCGVMTDAQPGDTVVEFTAFNLAPGTSCTISFDVTCGKDGAFVDTAFVRAYCAGSETSYRELQDIAMVVCKEARSACPRTRGFWRQQTEQKDNGSRKICAADAGDGMDMYRLWRGVIDMTDLTSFKTNDGGTVLVSDLRNLSDADLFDALGCELEGPNPNTQRDQAETQYLALMLNVKMGLIGLDIHVDNGTFMGTVGEAIDAVEAILDNPASTNTQLSNAIDIADKINNRQGLMAQTCPGGENAPFGGFANSCPAGNVGFVCPDEDAPGHVDNTGSPAAGRFSLAAFPNPFNPTARLRWSVPTRMLGQHGVIEIFDAAGRSVAQVFEGTVSSEQNELVLAPDGWASGMYIARLTVGVESIAYRMVLVK